MAALQHIPYLGTAEEDVLFVEWLVDEGALVHKGAAMATVETLKAAFEVEAAHAGVVLRRLCEAGQRIASQAPIAIVGQPGESCDDADLLELLSACAVTTAPLLAPAVPAVSPQPFTGAATAPVAPAARRRASELGVDLDKVRGTGPEGLVRAADVERAHASPAVPSAAAAAAADDDDGRLDAEFLAMIRRDETAFAALAADFKLLLYRQNGASIGPHCHFGARVVLHVERLVLGERAYFGPDTVVAAKELVAGPLLHLGARCRVRCTRLQFGENAFLADDVEIGGGGAMEPEAELAVGSHGFVGEHVHLNPCRTLRIGDEVVVSRSAVVMTHSFGPSWLRGYPSRFAGVEIGDGAQLGIGVTLFPGVQIGAGAVVLSGSSVVTAVPSGRLFGGVPAVDLKAAAQQLSPAEVGERAAELIAEFARQLQLRGVPVVLAKTDDAMVLVVMRDDGEHRLEFRLRADWSTTAPATAVTSEPSERVLVAVDFADAEFLAAPATTTVIALEPPRIRGPLGSLAAAFREFLRKRGVRLHPRGWAYTGGWL